MTEADSELRKLIIRENNEKELLEEVDGCNTLIIETFRERTRNLTIKQRLLEEMTSRFAFNCQYGQGYFFEYDLTSPYEFDHIFTIIPSKNLRLVVKDDEWVYHRFLNDFHQRIELMMFQQVHLNKFEVLVHGKETIRLPLVLQLMPSEASSDEWNYTPVSV